MSVKKELKQFKNLVGVKKALILEGNVDDVYELNGKYVNIHEIIKDIFEAKGFKDKFSFDKNAGLRGNKISNLILTSDDEDKTKEAMDDFNDMFGDGDSKQKDGEVKIKKPIEFFTVLNKNLNREDKRRMGFIADYSDYIFSDQSLSEDDNSVLTEFVKTLKESDFEISEIGELTSSVIFVTKKINQLPPSLYLDNPDLLTLTLPKPSREERETFLNTVKPRLTTVVDIDVEFNNIVDSMDGWTLKEISHFVKFAANFGTPATFKSMINIYLYGEQTSPWEELSYEKMLSIRDFLKNKVIGQGEAIDKVAKVIYKAFTGLSGVTYSSKRSKPKGTLFFVGPTGTGKTELAKAITTFLFNDESNLIRFDMSEYGQDNSDQKLIGAPPGYVGFEGGGQLTNAIKQKPFSVVLFDEIEKASPKIFDKFLQILEDGRLTDNTGQTVSFSETFIIFTSNIGASEVNPSEDKQHVYKQFIEKVQHHFTHELNRPELLGRFGNNIVPFNFIQDPSLQAKIIAQKIKPVQLAVYEKYKAKVTIDINNPAIVQILTKDADPKRGGRDVVNSLETNFVDPLSDFIFNNLQSIKPNTEIISGTDGTKLLFKING